MITDKRRQIVESLRDKEYRDLFVAEHISQGIAFQIRATREARGWTQQQLAEKVGKHQETISQVEDPDYGKLTLKTLKRLASALDVALIVRFVPFSQLVDYVANLSPDDLAVPSFNIDRLLQEPASNALSTVSAGVTFGVLGGPLSTGLLDTITITGSTGSPYGTAQIVEPEEPSNVTNIQEYRLSHAVEPHTYEFAATKSG